MAQHDNTADTTVVGTHDAAPYCAVASSFDAQPRSMQSDPTTRRRAVTARSF